MRAKLRAWHATGPAVLLIRHGETAWSKSGQHTSRTDIDAHRGGARPAPRRSAGGSPGARFALVLTSPMRRARDTAALAGLGDGAEVTEDLHEVGYGSYEGPHHARDPRGAARLGPVAPTARPDGEPLEDAGARADRVIARVLEADGDVALVAHGHILRVLGARWIGLPAAGGGSLGLGTAALCDLGFERERRVIWRWNDTGD